MIYETQNDIQTSLSDKYVMNFFDPTNPQGMDQVCMLYLSLELISMK